MTAEAPTSRRRWSIAAGELLIESRRTPGDGVNRRSCARRPLVSQPRSQKSSAFLTVSHANQGELMDDVVERRGRKKRDGHLRPRISLGADRQTGCSVVIGEKSGGDVEVGEGGAGDGERLVGCADDGDVRVLGHALPEETVDALGLDVGSLELGHGRKRGGWRPGKEVGSARKLPSSQAGRQTPPVPKRY